MTSGSRYQRRTKRGEQGEIVTWTGVDAVTGLPVLVYDMPGRPRRESEQLESEHIPGVLATSFDGQRGELVVAFSAVYRPLRADEVDAAVVLAVAEALFDASQVGLVHGDLRPERFLIASGHVLVEGYGVPWRPRDDALSAPEGAASLAADVFEFAASFLELGRERLGPEVVAALEAGTAADPSSRPSAAGLHGMLEQAGGTRETPDAAERPSDRERAPAPERPPAFAEPARASDPARMTDPEPLVIDTDSGEEPLRTSPTSSSSGGFSKEPPPGTRYRSGYESHSPEPGRFKLPSLHDGQALGGERRLWYRFVLLGATLVLVATLALLALSRQGDRLADPVSARTVVYVVEVAVEPANLPPVTLYVVDGPNGSKWQAGTALGNVPGRVVLDREGTWELQARFQDRLSQVATLDLPAERAVTIDFTPARAVREP